eukprot:7034375-Ditylum_brightwellii.AAC.1
MDWATPAWWDMKHGLVQELLVNFDSIVIANQKKLQELVKENVVSKGGGNDAAVPWGFINDGDGNGNVLHHFYNVDDETKIKEVEKKNKDVVVLDKVQLERMNYLWTTSCSRDKPAWGFTC